ncbi:hypothetical protein P692DRAFT_201711540 [Suillus brevipes Sb2]|nr:hypothetical protein P692DRAFT_201711540 [Suillus brevipes Sb2]
MLKTIRKHNVTFIPLTISRGLKEQLPAWLHIGALPKTYHKNKDSCLQQVHNVNTIKHMHELTRRLTERNTHNPHATCACQDCEEDKQTGCNNPHKCATTAKNTLDKIHPKYNLNTSSKKDDLTLTHRRLEKNTQARKQPQTEVTFNPSITIKKDLSEGFSIFVDPMRPIPIPAYRL